MRIGSTFGLSIILDTFLISFLIPGFINNVFSSSFQNVFVPNYIHELKIKKNTGNFQAACFLLSLVLGILLTIIALLFTDLFLEIMFPNKSIDYYELIRRQFFILLPCIVIWSFSSILIGLLEAHEFFKFSSVYSIFTSLSMIFCLLYYEKLGISTLALGMLIGAILELLFLIFITRKLKILNITTPNFKQDSIKILIKQFPIKTSSSLITGMTSFVTQFFAAQLIIGSITAFNYASKIPSLFSVIITTVIGSVFLPYFSKLILLDKEKAYKNLYKTLILIFILTIILSLIIFFFSSLIIELLFQRGNFTSIDTFKVSSIQRILIFHVPFYCCSILIIKFLTSMNKNIFMVYASIINLALNVLLSKYLMSFMKIEGLALANLIMYVVNFITLFIFLRWQYNRDSKKWEF